MKVYILGCNDRAALTFAREIVNIIKKGSFVIPINDYFKRESYN